MRRYTYICIYRYIHYYSTKRRRFLDFAFFVMPAKNSNRPTRPTVIKVEEAQPTVGSAALVLFSVSKMFTRHGNVFPSRFKSTALASGRRRSGIEHKGGGSTFWGKAKGPAKLWRNLKIIAGIVYALIQCLFLYLLSLGFSLRLKSFILSLCILQN